MELSKKTYEAPIGWLFLYDNVLYILPNILDRLTDSMLKIGTATPRNTIQQNVPVGDT